MTDAKTFAGEAPATQSEKLDVEHNIQVELLDAVAEALDQNRNETHALIEQLHIYTQVHFMSEQLLMRLNADPKYEAHAKQHDLLLQELSGIRSLVEKGDNRTAREKLAQHGKMLVEHINGQDAAIKRVTAEKNS